MLDEGGDVGAEEVLSLTETDDEGGVAAGADDQPGLVAVHRQEGESAFQTCDDGAEGGDEIAGGLILAAEEDRGDLGVGLGAERVPLAEQLGLQFREVLDDAVVDDGELVVVGEVGVRVGVGRPPWVAHRV